MIIYTAILGIGMILGLGAKMEAGEPGADILIILILLPVFGRVFGWW
jgi:hypothetical protein